MAESLWEKEGESGLLDNFEFTITASYFATNEKYTDDAGEHPWLINWEGTTDSLDVPIMHVWYSLGKGWVVQGRRPDHRARERCRRQVLQQVGPVLQDHRPVSRPVRHGADSGEAWRRSLHRCRMGGRSVQDGERVPARDPRCSGQGRRPCPPPSLASSRRRQAPTVRQKPAAAAKDAKRDAAGQDEAAQGREGRCCSGCRGWWRGRPCATKSSRSSKANSDDFEAAQMACLELPDIMDDDDLVQELMDADGLFAEANKANA